MTTTTSPAPVATAKCLHTVTCMNIRAGRPCALTGETCEHEHVRQISEHDVECLDCGIISA